MIRRTPEQIDAEHAQHVGSGPHDGPRCKCRHDGISWLAMCDAATAAYKRFRESCGRSAIVNAAVELGEHKKQGQLTDEELLR
jgi:hypothetical protein